MNQQTMTKAKFAQLCGVSKTAVAKWIQKGVAAMAANQEIQLAVTADRMRALRGAGLPPAFEKMMTGVPGALASVAPAPVARPSARTLPKGAECRRADLVSRLQALDWQKPFTESDDIHERVLRAAQAVGFEVAETDVEDDGHWGGYQLRSLSLLEALGGLDRDAVVAGFGFELDAFDALRECREVILHPDHSAVDDDDLFVIDIDLLPALAYPFGPTHCP